MAKKIRLNPKEAEEYMMNYADNLNKRQIRHMKKYLRSHSSKETYSFYQLDCWAFLFFGDA